MNDALELRERNPGLLSGFCISGLYNFLVDMVKICFLRLSELANGNQLVPRAHAQSPKRNQTGIAWR